MAKKGKTNGKAPEVVVEPANTLLDVAKHQIRIAELLGSIDIREAALENAINLLSTQAAQEVDAYKAELFARAKAVEAYAEENKKSLTVRGQTVDVPHGGSFQWYSTSPSVRIKKKEMEDVLKRIKRRKLTRFIRVTEEIDKQALLAEPKVATTITGVEIDRDEKFAIRPPNRDERVEHNLSTGKRQIVTTKKEAAAQEKVPDAA